MWVLSTAQCFCNSKLDCKRDKKVAPGDKRRQKDENVDKFFDKKVISGANSDKKESKWWQSDDKKVTSGDKRWQKGFFVWQFFSNKPAQSVDLKASERKWKLLNLFCCFCYEHVISYVGLESKIYYFKGKLVPDYNVTSYWRVGHTHLQTYAGIISFSPSIILFHENWLHKRD